jgi:prevent-host-death family protein
MGMAMFNIHEAKTNLSKLIRQAMEGEKVVIAKGNRPLVQLIPIIDQEQKRRIGGSPGLIQYMSEDFDEPVEDFKPYMK